jgi:hypothetical protein
LELVRIFEGPTVFAQMLRDELEQRGIAVVVRAAAVYSGIMAEQVLTPFSQVLISDDDFARRREQVDECLALVSPVEEGLGEEEGDDGSA